MPHERRRFALCKKKSPARRDAAQGWDSETEIEF